MKFLRAICLIVLFAAMLSCTKKVSELPPITQTGANTFGCKVSGELWVPGGFGPFATAEPLEAIVFPNGEFYLKARNFSTSPVEKEFEIFIKDLNGPGTYLFNTNVGYPTRDANYAYYVRRNFNPQNEWITSAQYNGSITFTVVDTVRRFVSGTFQFNAINMYNDPIPISVTEGRFDVSTQQ